MNMTVIQHELDANQLQMVIQAVNGYELTHDNKTLLRAYIKRNKMNGYDLFTTIEALKSEIIKITQSMHKVASDSLMAEYYAKRLTAMKEIKEEFTKLLDQWNRSN